MQVSKEVDISIGVRKRVRLLIVDDRSEELDELVEYIGMYNPSYSIEHDLISKGSDAIGKLGTWAPTVALLDVHIPDVNGLQLIKTVSEAGVPVVAASRDFSREIESSVLENGAVAYVTINDDPEELEGVVELLARVAMEVAESH